jgi:FtsH-binding integral membrane protein
MNVVIYGLFAISLLCAAAAIWSLYTSPEEQANRSSFIYKYGGFFAYILLAVLFATVLFVTPRHVLEEGAVKLITKPLGPVASFAAGEAYGVYRPKFRKNSLLG